MDLKDEELSAGERAEMRDRVTTGVRRMRALRARRRQTAAVAAAVVLVAAVVTGVSFAALRPADRVAEPVTTTSAPTPSATEEPTETPIPTPAPTVPVANAPASAVPPFGGDCANALSIESVSAWAGTDMRAMPQRWVSPEITMSGGMTCLWNVPDAYMWGYLELTAFPAALFEPTGSAPLAAGECDEYACRAAAVVDGTWIALTWVGALPNEAVSLRTIGPAEFAELFALLGDSAGAHDQPRAAKPAASWWPESACDLVAAGSPHLTRIDAGQTVPADLVTHPGRAQELAQLGTDGCSWSTPDGVHVVMRIVPGGASTFDGIAATELAEPVDVAGSDGAVVLQNNFVWEFNGDDLVVRSGDNLLIVGSQPVERTDAITNALRDVAVSTLSVLNAGGE